MEESSSKVLQPFLEMARSSAASNSSNLSTIRTLVLKVLSHAQIFAGFDQIKLEIQGSCAGNSDGDVLLGTLDLFSYGTYNDYASDTSKYLPLTQGQLQKLRQLTVVSLVQQAYTTDGVREVGAVSYEKLAYELGFSTTRSLPQADDKNILVYRQVEEVAISCIYASIASGHLCQKTKSFLLSARDGPPCRARDVPPSQIQNMLSVLTSLQERLDTTAKSLNASRNKTQVNRETNAQYWKNLQERTNKLMSGSGGLYGGGGGGPTPVGWSSSETSTARSRDSTNRQNKRSRGGFGGGGTTGDAFYGRF